jgi:hypothetical protein
VADNAIRIPVVIELDQANQQLVAFKRTAETQVGAAGVTLQKTLAETEKRTAAATTGMRTQLQGVGPAVGAVTNAFRLMGVQAPQGLGAISAGIGSLLATGLGPLSIAIAAGTAAISLFASTSASAAEGVDEAAEAVKKLEDRYLDLAKAIDAANLSTRAERSSMSDEERSLVERREAIRAEIEGRTDGRAPQTEEKRLEIRRLMQSGASAEIKEGAEGLRVFDGLLDRSWEDSQKLNEELELIEKKLRAIGRLSETTRPFMKRQLEDWQTVVDPYDDLMPPLEGVMAEERRRAEAIERGLRAVRNRQDEDWQTTIDPNADLMPPESGVAEMERKRAAAIERQLKAVRDRQLEDWQTEDSGRLDIEDFTANLADPVEQSELSKGIEAAATRGLSDAFMDPSNWRDSLSSFADAVQRALADAAAQGLVAALTGKSAGSGGLMSALGSVFGVGGDAAATVPAATEGAIAVAGAADAPIMVTIVGDEMTADSILSRASARGFRVGMAKAGGDGVAAGSISRRRGG